MSSRTILVCIFCSLIVHKATASEAHRETVRVILPQDISEESIKNNLKQIGVYLDERAIFYIHEEENYIDLTCFDCIIRNVDSEVDLSGSFNERTSKHTEL